MTRVWPRFVRVRCARTAPMEWPGQPWHRDWHVDYAGPMDGKMGLIVIDAHITFIDVISWTQPHLVRQSRSWGVLVSDNAHTTHYTRAIQTSQQCDATMCIQTPVPRTERHPWTTNRCTEIQGPSERIRECKRKAIRMLHATVHAQRHRSQCRVSYHGGHWINNAKAASMYRLISLNCEQNFGNYLSSKGLEPDPDKIAAIVDMTPPTIAQELQSFLGMVNYLSRYTPDLATNYSASPWSHKERHYLYVGPEYQKAFDNVKKAITAASTLAYFDTNKPVTIQIDASKRGVWATILQHGRPVAYAASKSLTETESNYCNIEREILVIWVETRENQRHDKMRWNTPSVNQYCDKWMATVHKSMSRRHNAVLELHRRDRCAQWCSSEKKPCHHTKEHARGGFDEDTHWTSRHRKMSTSSTRYSVLVCNKCRHWQHGQEMYNSRKNRSQLMRHILGKSLVQTCSTEFIHHHPKAELYIIWCYHEQAEAELLRVWHSRHLHQWQC